MCAGPKPGQPAAPAGLLAARAYLQLRAHFFNGHLLPAGASSTHTRQVGEVCIRGPNVTKGYKENPKANEEAFAGEPG